MERGVLAPALCPGPLTFTVSVWPLLTQSARHASHSIFVFTLILFWQPPWQDPSIMSPDSLSASLWWSLTHRAIVPVSLLEARTKLCSAVTTEPPSSRRVANLCSAYWLLTDWPVRSFCLWTHKALMLPLICEWHPVLPLLPYCLLYLEWSGFWVLLHLHMKSGQSLGVNGAN